MAKRRRRSRAVQEQLSFDLAAVTPPPPVVQVDEMTVGYFRALKMSTGHWWLTVAPPKFSYLVEDRTPTRWWAECCSEEYTLHGWCPDKVHVLTERDDVESPPTPFDVRVKATRWLKSFNESYQLWRMEAC